jgi:predicted Zn-dependent peptidase
VYKEFASSGPTDSELDAARKDAIADVQGQVKDPRAWSATLSLLTYRARNLDALVNYEAEYNAITAAQVKECFQKYYLDDQTIRVLVKPEAPPPESVGPALPKPPGK